MSQSSSTEALDRIVQRDVSKVARNSTILYGLSAVAVIVGARVISAIFRGFSYPGQFETVVDGLVSIITLYAVIIFLWTRSRLSRGIGIHFYVLGVLGLIGGGLLFAFGAVQFLSAGYWVRQFKGEHGPRCARDGGSVVAYGEDSLVCTRCSRLVRIMYDLPRKWTYAGLAILLAGIAWSFLVLVAPDAARLTSPFNPGYVLLIDGISFLGTWFAQFTYLGGGNVRLPPGIGEAGTSGVSTSKLEFLTISLGKSPTSGDSDEPVLPGESRNSPKAAEPTLKRGRGGGGCRNFARHISGDSLAGWRAEWTPIFLFFRKRVELISTNTAGETRILRGSQS